MPPWQCPLHEKCPDPVQTPAGTFCRQTGTEIWGPELTVGDWSTYCNPVQCRLTKGAVAARREKSISIRKCRAVSVEFIGAALYRLYGTSADRGTRRALTRGAHAQKHANCHVRFTTLFDLMRKSRAAIGITGGISSTGALGCLSAAISALAVNHGVPRHTYAGARGFPETFVAAVMDAMVTGITVGQVTIVPALAIAKNHKIPPDQLRAMGISCRAMGTCIKQLKKTLVTSSWAEGLARSERANWVL
jgi:hypothetical protein